MSEPKRHHYVPRMLIRRFASADESLWSYNKKARQGSYLRTNPEGVFLERHLYSSVDSSGQHDPALEKEFAELEGKTNTLLEKMTTAARANQLPQLTAEERETWNSYTYYQWKRVPDFFRKLDFIESFEERTKNTIAELKRRGHSITPEQEQEFATPAFIKRLRQNALVKAISDPGAVVQDLLRQSGIWIGIVKAGEQFVLGSYPIARIPLGDTSAQASDVAAFDVWIPIAPDIVVGRTKTPGETIGDLTEERVVQHVNDLLLRQSSIIAGPSREALEAIVMRSLVVPNGG